jgi:[NiFe] hydrogenase diaphorase moiety large subunit
MCDQGPALLVNGLAVTALTLHRVDRIAELVEAGVPLEHWPAKFFVVQDNIHRAGDLLSNAEKMSAGLQRFLELGPQAALEELEASVLRGRGGAGFTTALKWRICRTARVTSASSSATPTRVSPAPSRTGSCLPVTPIWCSRA